MNTYDFDQTIFNPDSSYCFYMYCLKHYTGAVLKTIPGTVGKLLEYKKNKGSAKPLKEQLFSFLSAIPDVDSAVSAFWDENSNRIESWYLRQKKSDDIIISASPEFLLKPICDKLEVRLIATRMDKNTGKIIGENCHDEEKVRRFVSEYPDAHAEKFYSDSLSDTPMARFADRAYIVNKDNIKPWPEEALD